MKIAVFRGKEVSQLVTIDFNGGNLKRKLASNLLHQSSLLLEKKDCSPWQNSTESFELESVLIIKLILVRAFHRESFASAGLAIGKEAYVVAIHAGLEKFFDFLKDIGLITTLWEYTI